MERRFSKPPAYGKDSRSGSGCWKQPFHIARAPRSWVYAVRTNIPYPRKSKKQQRAVKILTPRACLKAKKTLTLHPQNRPGKDAGVVDRGGLENRCALTGTQGSNPCLSANRAAARLLFFYGRRRSESQELIIRFDMEQHKSARLKDCQSENFAIGPVLAVLICNWDKEYQSLELQSKEVIQLFWRLN